MSNANDQLILKRYIPLVKFLGDVLGKHYEIVLHDYTNPKRSVIAIEHGELSGRRVGSPMTDLSLKQTIGQYMVLAHQRDDDDVLSNYYASSDSGRVLKASTYTIRNDADRIIGALCINMNVEPYDQIYHILESIGGVSMRISNDRMLGEFLSDSSQTTAQQLIARILAGLKPVQEMSTKEKHATIKRFYEEGLFQIKGTVNPAAQALDLSPATVYRHVATLKKATEGAPISDDVNTGWSEEVESSAQH